jgi:16S rRNA G966 N2-methylase RsmD
MTNWLYCGDNLSILREHIADASVDLVYLDPPFNSNATYNVLFKALTASRAVAEGAAVSGGNIPEIDP